MAVADEEYPEPNVDKQGRICDKQGRPLRDRRSRNFGKQPFKGQAGSPDVRQKRLAIRVGGFEDIRVQQGKKRPGSLTK